MLPNFIIVGAPKSGTTSLYHYLSGHPEVFMSNPKEVNFFSGNEIQAQGLFYDSFQVHSVAEYETLFEKAEEAKAVGEGSVSYLFYPHTPKKIHKLLPNVKIIILLRNPLDRGYSHYLMDYRLGLVSLSYDEIVHKSGSHKNIDLYYQQYVELGLYYEQVKRYLDLFGPEQVKIYFQDDLHKNTENIVQNLFTFLEVNPTIKLSLEKEHNTFSMPKTALIHKLYSAGWLRSTLTALLPERLKEILIDKLFERKKSRNSILD
ncbi:MAG: sulfotransferase [Sulfurimonas sp.]